MNTTQINKINEFRDGIFALRTRRFGSVAEIMIQKLFNLQDSGSLAFDKKSGVERIEIKFSTAMKKNKDKIREDNVVNQCLSANVVNRALKSIETAQYKFDCNIQQIKCKEFDILYYGLFFADKIEIFRMNTTEVLNYPGYSNNQHRGNKDEGQFHLNQDNIDFHRAHYFIQSLDYNELFELFTTKS